MGVTVAEFEVSMQQLGKAMNELARSLQPYDVGPYIKSAKAVNRRGN